MRNGSWLSLAALGLTVACSSAPVATSAPPAQPAAQAETVVNASGGSCTAIKDGLSLCQTTSSCPGLTVDQTAFPNCGFEIHGDKIDLECNCGGDLCAMGASATCDDATQLMSTLTVQTVCERALTHHCLDLAAIGGNPSSCQICKENCSGNPACLQACGC